jgi:hypothetical protein
MVGKIRETKNPPLAGQGKFRIESGPVDFVAQFNSCEGDAIGV